MNHKWKKKMNTSGWLKKPKMINDALDRYFILVWGQKNFGYVDYGENDTQLCSIASDQEKSS